MSSRNERPKQVDRILDYMRRYGSITTLDAMLDLGILRLASRISELKKAGLRLSYQVQHRAKKGKTLRALCVRMKLPHTN